jgi:hypothetical protein
MNVLYKYCDQLGIVKILGSLELKLPYISEVNDPLECKPYIDKQGGIIAMEEQCRRSLKRKGREPSGNWRQVLQKKIQTGEDSKLQEKIVGCIDDMKQKSCLLSVSETAQNTVMWAHYSDKHKGGVIGIDFDNIFPGFCINMERVDYSEQRPKLNIWDISYSSEFKKKYYDTLITKSSEWHYEKEFRNIFDDTDLMNLEQQGLAYFKNFNSKKTWFLRLNPESIREVIFGLFAEDSLKQTIKNLVKMPELQHVKLYKAKESEAYTLDLIELVNNEHGK